MPADDENPVEGATASPVLDAHGKKAIELQPDSTGKTSEAKKEDYMDSLLRIMLIFTISLHVILFFPFFYKLSSQCKLCCGWFLYQVKFK